MSDSQASSDKTSATSFILPIVVVIILIAAVGYFATMQSGLDEKVVKAKLDSWIASYQQANPDRAISYGSLEIAGPVNDRFARLHDVVIDNAPEEKDQRYKLTMPMVDINPESLAFERFAVSIAEPMQLSTDDNTIEISSNAPIRADIELVNDGSPAVKYDIPMPGNLTLDSQEKDTLIVISSSEGSKIAGQMPQSGTGQR